MKEVQFRYNPVAPMVVVPPKLNFNQLDTHHQPDSSNFITLNHRAIGVPWLTSLPAPQQSRHWCIAKSAAREIIKELIDGGTFTHGALPAEINTTRHAEKVEELVNTAASCVIHLFPSEYPRQTALVTKTLVLLWIHDDVVEPEATNINETCLDYAVSDSSKSGIIQSLFRQITEENLVAGLRLVEGVLSFTKFTRTHKSLYGKRFETIREYFEFREQDIAAQYMVAAVEFSAGLALSTEDLADLNDLVHLYGLHSFMINDLYSYDKEVREKNSGCSVSNAVMTIQDILDVSPLIAKSVLLNKIWDVEMMMEKFLIRWYTSHEASEQQLRFAQCLIQSAAGNVFFSATVKRYAEHGTHSETN
ncbi:terpenoid synthase [Sarocladium strictum]